MKKEMTKEQLAKLKKLTYKERIVYDAVMRDFPATSFESAYDTALQGGVKFNFIFK